MPVKSQAMAERNKALGVESLLKILEITTFFCNPLEDHVIRTNLDSPPGLTVLGTRSRFPP